MKRLILAIFLACLALSSAQAGKSHSDGAQAVSKGQWATAGGATAQAVKKDASLSRQAYERCCEKSKGLRKDCCKKVGK